MRHHVLLTLALCLAGASPARAQWHVGAGTGVQGFGRWIVTSPDQPGGGPEGRPTGSWPVHADLQYGGDRHRVGVAIRHSRPGLELFDADLRIALRPAFDVLTLAPEVSTRLLRFSQGGQLRLGIGLPIERWSFPGSADTPRWRAGAEGTLTIELPVTARVSARVAAATGRMFRHPFANTDQAEDYIPTGTWRRALRFGVGVRL